MASYRLSDLKQQYLTLTLIPEKVSNIKDSQDIFNTNHKIVNCHKIDDTITGVSPLCTNAENLLSNIQLTLLDVENALNTIDSNISPGPD